MKHIIKITLITFSIMVSANAVLATDIQHLTFLSGCWSQTDENGTTTVENWLKPSKTTMLGISQTKNSANWTVSYEFLRLESNPLLSDDPIVYTPVINGHEAASFTYDDATSLPRDERAVFVNSSNDFPKKIVYTLGASKDSIVVHLWGHDQNGSPFSVDYTLEADDCSKHL